MSGSLTDLRKFLTVTETFSLTRYLDEGEMRIFFHINLIRRESFTNDFDWTDGTIRLGADSHGKSNKFLIVVVPARQRTPEELKPGKDPEFQWIMIESGHHRFEKRYSNPELIRTEALPKLTDWLGPILPSNRIEEVKGIIFQMLEEAQQLQWNL